MWSDLQYSIASENAPSWTDVQPVVLSLILDHDQHGDGKTLCHYINYYSAQNYRDPRDKLYGLLGLVPEDQRPTVHYAKLIFEVHTDAALAMINLTKECKQQEIKSVRPAEVSRACLKLFFNMLELPLRQPKLMLLSSIMALSTFDHIADSSKDDRNDKAGSESKIDYSGILSL
jgi:hypothetical protein